MVYNLELKENINIPYEILVNLFDFKNKVKHMTVIDIDLKSDSVRIDFVSAKFVYCVHELVNRNEFTEDMVNAYKWFKENTTIEVEDRSNIFEPLYYSKSWDEVDNELNKLII